MIDEVVIVIRLINGEDILAILVKELDGKLTVEHPYFVKYNTALSNFGLVPYCHLSDETYYEIDRSKIDFVVTASDDVSRNFIKTISSSLFEPSVQSIQSSILVGNNTKH